jgi:hypothetical protein
MQLRFLLLVTSAIAFASCNTAYKSGQTPDDVYFSPSRMVVSEDKENKEEREETRQDETARNDSYEAREIRMRIRDRRWRDLNNDYACNCSCDYTPYKYGYGYGYYYNPYYYPAPVYFINSTYLNPKLTPVRTANLGGYNPVVTVKTINPKTGNTEYKRKIGSYNNSNTTTREVYAPSNNRTYSPANNSTSNSSSNSSSQSSSGKSVQRSPRN